MSVGEKLRRERVRTGIDLDTLARDTRIAKRYLEAIEADDSSGCPGQFFYRSFVRQYASCLGLDPAEIEREIGAPEPVVVSMPRPAAPQDDEFPLRAPDPIIRASNRVSFGGGMRLWASILAFVAVVVACSALYASWRHRETSAVEQQLAVPNPKLETPVSQQTQPTATPTPVPVAPEPVQGGGTGAVQTPSTATAAPPDAKTAADTKSAQEAVAKRTEPAAGSPGTSPAVNTASPDDKVVVSVSAKEPAWVALSSDGKAVYSGTLDAAQTKTVGGKEQARMRVGNAGGVEVTLTENPSGRSVRAVRCASLCSLPPGTRL